MRLYLAGPMTGVKDWNIPLFTSEAARLRAMGHEIVNPAEINAPYDEAFVRLLATLTGEAPRRSATERHWRDCMRRDLAQLVHCDGIALLPDWQASRGATLEHHVAISLGMVVFTAALVPSVADLIFAEA